MRVQALYMCERDSSTRCDLMVARYLSMTQYRQAVQRVNPHARTAQAIRRPGSAFRAPRLWKTHAVEEHLRHPLHLVLRPAALTALPPHAGALDLSTTRDKTIDPPSSRLLSMHRIYTLILHLSGAGFSILWSIGRFLG
jgi:hypothetical protein